MTKDEILSMLDEMIDSTNYAKKLKEQILFDAEQFEQIKAYIEENTK